MFSRERDALEMLRPGYPQLINCLGSGVSRGKLGILMSPVADMDLAQFLRDHPQGSFPYVPIDLLSTHATLEKIFGSSWLDSPPQKRLKWLFDQVRGLASALSHIHDSDAFRQSCSHGDIKPNNILVMKERGGLNFRLTDFGSASFAATASTERSKPLPVTPMYCAPECYGHTRTRRQTDRSADNFSLGCVYAELLTWMLGIRIEDFESFRSPDPSDRAFCSKLDRVMLWLDKLRERAKHKIVHFSCHNLFDMIPKMMSINPNNRPTAKEVHLALSPKSCIDVPDEGSDVPVDSQLQSGTPGLDKCLWLNNTARKHVMGSGRRTILPHVVRLLINGRLVDAVPDTGSDQNVISGRLASQLNLVIDPGHEDLSSFLLANGTVVRPIGTVKLNWALVTLPEESFSSVFYVMKDISSAVLGWSTVDKLQLFTKNRHLMETRPADMGSPLRCLHTGSEVDLISHDFFARWHLTLKKPSPDVEQVQLANGKTVSIAGRVKLKCEVLLQDWDNESPMKTQRVTFHVMRRLTQDILLGNGFCSKISMLKMHLMTYYGRPGFGIPSFSSLVDRSDGSGSKAGEVCSIGHNPSSAPTSPLPNDPQSSSRQETCTEREFSLIVGHQLLESPEGRDSGHDPPAFDLL